MKTGPRASALNRPRRVDARVQQPLCLQPRKRVVDGSDREPPARFGFKVLPDAETIGLVTEAADRQQHAQFELAEPVAFGHLFDKRELNAPIVASPAPAVDGSSGLGTLSPCDLPLMLSLTLGQLLNAFTLTLPERFQW